ncbi:hypothetical protein WJU23_02725 [Prosthecobacter sp. SYSU 5D2]|uniref:hypothetical protein n=1 Tax=Prosthecobacter sp. SYSU 5D2 TaxID=3134134 RepID=UPI0031FF2B36
MNAFFCHACLLLFLGLSAVPATGLGQTPAAAEMNPKIALEGMPRDLLRRLKEPSADYNSVIEEADKFVKGNVHQKTATLSFKIKEVDTSTNHITLISALDEERISGTPFVVGYTIMLNQDQKSLADKFKRGSRVTATCAIFCHISRNYSKPKLVIEGYKPVFH